MLMSSASNSGRRVLVVDDQPACAGILVQLLSMEGFSVDVASDGGAAVRSTT